MFAVTLARYITDEDVPLYDRFGWQCTYLGRVRGDDLICFLATFVCCQGR
jgi:hypothetical protein